MVQLYPDDCLFCAKYLLSRGYTPEDLEKMKPSLKSFKKEYALTEIKKNFWSSTAAKLRELWPPGEKDGKYPWRDSVANLARRLQLMWSIRFPDKSFSEEQVLQVARQYLAQFEDDTTYMKLLKYFILKQDKMIQPNGQMKCNNTSTLADMLESAEDQGWFSEPEVVQEESYPQWEGEIV